MLRVVAYDRRPFTNAPSGDDAGADVRVRLGERLGDGRRGAAEEQYATIGRLRERATEHQFPAGHGLARERDVFDTERGPPLHVIVDDVVHQQVVHARGWYHATLHRATRVSGWGIRR